MEANCIASSVDDPILEFVRQHLPNVRGSLSYLQIAGGDGVNVVANLRVVDDPDGRTMLHPGTVQCDRSNGMAESTLPVLQDQRG